MASDDPNHQHHIIWYYHAEVIGYLIRTYNDRIRTMLINEPKKIRTKYLLDNVKAGQKFLYGDDAWNVGFNYLKALEGELESIFQTHSTLFWLHLYRRIGVILPPIMGNKVDPTTVGLVRQIVELSISKYGSSLIHDDLQRASTVRLKDVMGGHFQRVWLKLKQSKEKIAVVYKEIAQSDQLIMVQFSIADLLRMFLCEGLAYEYWRTTAMMRGIGKGLGIANLGEEWLSYDTVGDLEELTESYDERISRTDLTHSLVGVWFGNLATTPRSETSAIVPVYNVDQQSYHSLFPKEFNTGSIPNFLPMAFDFLAYSQGHRFMAAAFHKKYGFSLETLMSVLWALCMYVVAPRPSDEKMLSEGRVTYPTMINFLQRGYGLWPNDLASLVLDIRALTASGPLSLDSISDEILVKCVNELVLDDSKRSQIGLWSGGRRFPLVPYEASYGINLEGIPSLLYGLFVRVAHETNEKGTVFEKEFQAALRARDYEVPCVGEITNNNGNMREIDASVRLGSDLVLFECRSSERPLDFEIGRPKTLKERCRILEEKVTQVLSLRDFVTAHPVGRNYDFSWARNVSAFVVSPFVEWTWSRSERLWHDRLTPRILQADEALEMLRKRRG